MAWFGRPKVIAGVLINGTYLLFCLLPSANNSSSLPPPTPSRYGPTRSHVSRPLSFVSLPPSTGPTKASYYRDRDLLDVYLKDDLILVRRPDHQLHLSPYFSAPGYGTDEPDTVLLSFNSYS